MEKKIEFVVEDSHKSIIEKVKRDMLSIVDDYFDLYLDRSDDSTDIFLDPIFRNNRRSGKVGESQVDFDPAAYKIMFFQRAIGLLQIDEENHKTVRIKVFSFVRDENLRAEKRVDPADPHKRPKYLRLDSETNAAAFMSLLFDRVQQAFRVLVLKKRKGQAGRKPNREDYYAWKCLHVKGYSDKDEETIKAEWEPDYKKSRSTKSGYVNESSMKKQWNNIKKPSYYLKRFENEDGN